MNATDQTTHEFLYSMQDENVNDFIDNLFDDEGAFGEGDCAGL
jgi:hypothetical protein